MTDCPETEELNPEWVAMGQRLRWLRTYAKMTGVKFAEIFNYDQSGYSRLERGIRPIPRDVARNIAAHFGVTIDFLLEGVPDGLDRGWLDRLLATPQGIALIKPSDRGRYTDKGLA